MKKSCAQRFQIGKIDVFSCAAMQVTEIILAKNLLISSAVIHSRGFAGYLLGYRFFNP
jgi:hypothetical protein